MKVVDRIARILNCFSFEDSSMQLSRISEETGVPKSTTYRILQALTDHNLVRRDSDGLYAPGPMLFVLGQIVEKEFSIRKAASPVLEKLSKEFNCAAHLGALEGLELIYLDKKTSNNFFEFASQVGMRVPAHATALGKILLAYKDPGVLEKKLKDKELKRYTPNTITDPPKLLKHLEQCRKQGYAIDNEEISQGLKCIAAPVKNHDGEIEAAISLSKPTVQLDEDLENQAIDKLIDSTQKISNQQNVNLGGDRKS